MNNFLFLFFILFSQTKVWLFLNQCAHQIVVLGIWLFLRSGIEHNAALTVASQNCRGLTKFSKSMRVVRFFDDFKRSSMPAALVMCLQETHAMNQLVLNNRFHGSVVTDECSTGQLGTVILVDKSLDVVAQLGSGSIMKAGNCCCQINFKQIPFSGCCG